MQFFTQLVVTSAIFFAAICWGSSIRANKTLWIAGSTLGTSLEPLELVVEKRIMHKPLNIRGNSSDPLYKLQVAQQCGFSQQHL